MQWGRIKARAALAISIISLSISGCGSISTLSDKLLIGKSKKEILAPLTIAVLSPKQLWTYQLDTHKKIKNAKVQLLVQDNILYGVGNTRINALNKNTGALLWKENTGERITGGIKGNKSTIFVGTAKGNAIAFNAKTGQTQWVALLNSPITAISNIQDNKIAFRTLNGKIHLLSANDGSILWQRSHRTPIFSLQGASSPILTGPLLISGSDEGTITAYEIKTANKIWSIAPTTSNDQASQLTDLDAEMKVIGTTLFTAGYHGRVSGIDMRSGKTGWSLALSSYSGIDADQNALYVSDETGVITKLAPLTGLTLWSNKNLVKRQPTAPSIINGALIIVGDNKGYLHWIDTRTGNIIGRVQAHKTRITLPPVIDEKTIYSVDNNGLISAHNY